MLLPFRTAFLPVHINSLGKMRTQHVSSTFICGQNPLIQQQQKSSSVNKTSKNWQMIPGSAMMRKILSLLATGEIFMLELHVPKPAVPVQMHP